MKALVALLTTCTLAAGAAETFHEFTANDGRTLKAQVISYDGSTGKVKIKRDDGTALRVKVGAFSAEDQAYIREWEAISVFMSERSLPLTLSRVEDRKWKQTRETTQRGQGGNNSGGSMPGGPQGPGGGGDEGGDSGGGQQGGQQGGGSEVVATDKYARYHYQIKLSNRTPVPLKDLSVSYRIFYEQDRAVPEDSTHAPRQQSRSGSGMNGQEQGFYHAEPQSLEATGKINVDVLAPHGRKMVPTVGVTILNRNARSGAEGEMIDLEGEIKGIWVKVSMKAPDGTMRTREVALPRRIITTHTWSSAGTSTEKRG